ncbi:hypothetical protein ACU4GD_15590 [Cupriavidus basilensis]
MAVSPSQRGAALAPSVRALPRLPAGDRACWPADFGHEADNVMRRQCGAARRLKPDLECAGSNSRPS